MKTKKGRLLLLALVLLVVLVGCGTATDSKDAKVTQPASQPAAAQPAATPAKATPAKVTPAVSLVDQVKNTGHAKLFPTMVAKGPAVKDPAGDHYGDGCLRCHSAVNILENKDAKLDDFFPGGKYSNAVEGISCRVCHDFSGKNLMTLRNKGWESCGVCHVNSSGDPKLGSAVHHPQFQMIKGVAVGDLAAKPSFKYANMKDNFSCTDCHITNSEKHDFMVPGVTATHDASGIARTGTTMDYEKFKTIFNNDKCTTCHSNPQDTVDKLKQRQTEIGKKLDELKPIYDEWSKKVATLDKNDPNVKAFQNGATYFTFVETDSSKGAHNYEYCKQLLEKAEALWKTLK